MTDHPDPELQELARKLAEEVPAVSVVWDEKAQRQYREWWDSLSPAEQERHRSGMVAT